MTPPRRLRREARTVELMIRMHCRAVHADASGGPCPECVGLLAYAKERLGTCRFGAAKPTCGGCAVHCFHPIMRDRIRAAMRYSGPRMLHRHPYLAICHLLDRRH
jgi:hypothetical protein